MKERKNIVIIGDSYSTYKGYIPEGNGSYYAADVTTTIPYIDNVKKTWWKQLEERMNYNIILNDSWTGSTICKTGYDGAYCHESSFVVRLDKHIENGFFNKNKVDTIFIFGGTNDSWANSPIGELKYDDITEDDLKCALPAFCSLIKKAKTITNNIIVILNTELKDEIKNAFIEASKKLEINYLPLTKFELENGHPTILGMSQISKQVEEFIISLN